MFYVMEGQANQLWLVSVATNKHYPFKGPIGGEDWQRAAKQIERDDAPPEPEPETIQIVSPRPRPFDVGAQARIDLEEIKVKQ